MIRSLTPDMVRWAIQNEQLSYTERGRQLQVDRHTVKQAIDEFKRDGMSAFATTCLTQELRDIANGRTLNDAYTVYCGSDMIPRSKEAFRVILYRLGIDYIKLGTNV